MRETVFCCCLPVDTATRFVAVIDMLTGSLMFIMFGFYLRDIYTHDSVQQHQYPYFRSRMHYHYASTFEERTKEDIWIAWAIFVCSGVQCILGILLFRAVTSRSVQICRAWQYIAIATCFLTMPLVLRIQQILVVSDFCSWVNEEERLSNNNNNNNTDINNSQVVLSGPIVPQAVTPLQQRRVPMEQETTTIMRNTHVTTTTRMNPAYLQNPGSVAVISQQNGGNITRFPNAMPIPEEELPPPPYHLAITMPPAKI